MRIILFSAIVLLVLSCSKSDNSPAPSNTATCTSDLSTLTPEATYSYTGDALSITAPNFCKDDIVSVLVNDQEIQPTEVLAAKITFTVPVITGDSATIKVKTKSTTTQAKKKVAVFPGGGTWKEVASFPAQGRVGGIRMTVGSNAYLCGGNAYTGYTTTYNYNYFGDIYKYDPSANAWSLVVTNDNVKNRFNGTASSGGKLFLFPVTVNGPATTYDLTGASFGTTGNFAGGTALSNAPFSVGTDVYNCVIERSPINSSIVAMLIRKYNTGTNQWDLVATNPATTIDASTYVNFAFERSGKAYIGTNQINSTDVQFYSFDPATNQFTTLIKAGVGAPLDFPVLSYLFTINNLAYFIQAGSSSVSPTSVSVSGPGVFLYMYNFKNNTFHTATHTYPESFFRVTGLSIANRGFAGLGSSASGALFQYSQKFYEFTPK